MDGDLTIGFSDSRRPSFSSHQYQFWVRPLERSEAPSQQLYLYGAGVETSDRCSNGDVVCRSNSRSGSAEVLGRRGAGGIVDIAPCIVGLPLASGVSILMLCLLLSLVRTKQQMTCSAALVASIEGLGTLACMEYNWLELWMVGCSLVAESRGDAHSDYCKIEIVVCMGEGSAFAVDQG